MNKFLSLYENENTNVDKNNNYILTKLSHTIEAPMECKSIKLWEHQKAMIYRCLEIEQNSKQCECKVMFKERYMDKNEVPKDFNSIIGIMNDPPGSGKTYAILSVIAFDTKKTNNIIITPKNIFNQWIDSLKNIYPRDYKKSLKWTSINSYEDILLFSEEPDKMKKLNIILLNEIFVDAFALMCLKDSKIKITRLIIDEIDNIQNSMTQPIKSEKLWLLSASFKPESNDINKKISIGPYFFESENIPYITCNTDKEFIKESVKLEQPTEEIIKCNDINLLLFKNVVDDKIIKSLNSINIRDLLKYIDYNNTIFNEPINIEIYHTLALYYKDKLKDKIMKYTDIIEKYQDNYREFDTINTELNNSKLLLNKLEENIDNFEKSKEDSNIKNKSHMMIEIVKKIKCTENSKWLIVNDDYQGLLYAHELLNKENVKNSLLDGGNTDAVNEILQDYKNSDLKVLLINSITEGCGLNLSETTHILFMHKTEKRLIEQIIGRAQRYGRTNRLHIIALLNSNELEI